MLKNAFSSSITLVLLSLVFRYGSAVKTGNCASETTSIKRIPNTRFYMHKTEAVKFENAKGVCENLKPVGKHQLAKIQSREEDIIVGKYLTAFLRKDKPLTSRFYIGGQYVEKSKSYRWLEGNGTIGYHNLNEVYAKPIGRIPGCLTVGFPHPKDDIYGWGYTWDVVPCESLQFILCECTDSTPGVDWTFKYDAEAKLYSGVYPLSQRRFTISWEVMSYDDAVTFCSNYKLQLYYPHNADSCLFTFIKGHRPAVTKFHFWAARPKEAPNPEPKYCPAGIFVYETHNLCNCKWRYIVTAPADCELKNAVICEKEGDKTALTDTETCQFDNRLIFLDRKNDISRSEIKVDYETAAVECRKNTLELVNFKQLKNIDFKEDLHYDKVSDYWIYNKDTDKCSAVRYEERDETPAFKKFEANCTADKHFFLCGTEQNTPDTDFTGRKFSKKFHKPAGRRQLSYSAGNAL